MNICPRIPPCQMSSEPTLHQQGVKRTVLGLILIFLRLDCGSILHMQIKNKFRCYPNSVQEQVLLRWIGCSEIFTIPKYAKTSIFAALHGSLCSTRGSLPRLTPYLSEVPSVLLRNGAVLWKHSCVLVVAPRNPRYKTFGTLAVGDFIGEYTFNNK